MQSTEFKLRERIKELKCLYELSRIAWEEDSDLKAVLSKTIKILPEAMQHPELAEASVTVNNQSYTTPGFLKSKHTLSSPLFLNKKKCGMVVVGYRAHARKINNTQPFLAEEKRLLKMVAREVSSIIKRSAVEEEKVKLQEQLQHLERLALIGELSAGIAHELNEPLGKILGFAQLVKKSGELQEQQQEDIERIIKASLYTREIIKKLMFFSRQMPKQLSIVNLNEVIANILYFIDVRFQSRGIRIVQKLDENLPTLEADAVQMSQVVVNLISNAIYAMADGGNIMISTKHKNDLIMLAVTDEGCGMSNEVKKRIFEPFFTTKPVGQGTGLGLAVVQGIVEAHKGRIAVQSAPGKGSKFQIVLPVKQLKKA